MTYHWMEDGTTVSTTEFAAACKAALDYLSPDDPERENQIGMLNDLTNDYPEDMTTWELQILDDDYNIIRSAYHTGWFQEEAETAARNLNRSERGAMWQVIRIRN